jgi:protein phosphatase
VSDQKHVLSRAIGLDLSVNVDVEEQALEPGDALVLCTDGLHGPVAAEPIAGIVSHAGDAAAAARQLVETANQLDGGDNVSVQVIRVLGVERIGMYRGRPYKLK